MKIKRFFAKDMRQAIRDIREELGADAVILSNRRSNGGIEIIAAVDYDENIYHHMAQPQAGESRSQQRRPETQAREIHQPNTNHKPRTNPAKESPLRNAVNGKRANTNGKAHTAASVELKPEDLEMEIRPVQEADRAKDKKAAEWMEDPAIAEMKHEIKHLRGMLESQLSSLSLADLQRREPGKAAILHRFSQMGITADIAEQVLAKVPAEDDIEVTWRHSLALLSHLLQVTDDDILGRGGVVALVGPTGVGKTTSVAKLAARFTMRYGNKSVALISTDNYRIGAQEQLLNFGRILDIPTYMASSAEELKQRLRDLCDKRLVLIDTAGMSQRDLRLSQELAQIQDSSQLVRSYLVMAANTQTNTLSDVMRAFNPESLSGCILTKLDETTSMGGALSTLLRYQLPVAYVSDGQRVPEDMRPARAHSLISRAVTMMQQEELQTDKLPVPNLFNRNLANAHV